MKRFLLGTILGLVSMGAYAGPASTFSADINDYAGFQVTNQQGALRNCTMETALKVPGSKKDLLIGVSLQSGLMTETYVKGKKGETDLATAEGSVNVAVMVDDAVIPPGVVTFNSRKQELEATFGGVLESCTLEGCTTDMDPDSPTYGELTCSFDKEDCIWTDEDIRLMLETTSANHFNFVAPDVGVGEHTIKVCVGINALASDSSVVRSWAALNLGSLTVEVVKAANTDTGITIDP